MHIVTDLMHIENDLDSEKCKMKQQCKMIPYLEFLLPVYDQIRRVAEDATGGAPRGVWGKGSGELEFQHCEERF
jgi:hypothetical protein